MVSCLQIPSHLLKMTHRVHCEIPFDFYFTFPLLSFKKNKTSSPWSLPMDTDLCNLYTKRQHLGEGGNVGKLAKLVPWQIGIWEAGLLPLPGSLGQASFCDSPPYPRAAQADLHLLLQISTSAERSWLHVSSEASLLAITWKYGGVYMDTCAACIAFPLHSTGIEPCWSL